jgi:hypothetical protein
MKTTAEKIEKKAEACETFRPAYKAALPGKTECISCGHPENAHEPYSLRQARAQLASIKEMVANLTLEGAARVKAEEMDEQELIQVLTDNEDIDSISWASNPLDLEELREKFVEATQSKFADLEAYGLEWDEDRARQTIQEDALSVEVRSDWHTPGDEDGKKPAEFCILLCTGGPAVRILGELDEHGEPTRAWLEHQDWGTSWQHFITQGEDNKALLTYCQQFYFSEE